MKQYLNNALSFNNKKFVIQEHVKIVLTKQNSTFKISTFEKKKIKMFVEIFINKRRLTVTFINL